MSRRNRRRAVLSAARRPMSLDEFEATVWCADCDATVHTVVVDGYGFVDVRHASTCPNYLKLTEGSDR